MSTGNQYTEDGDVILDGETKNLYRTIEEKGNQVHANIYFLENKMDKMNPEERKQCAREIDTALSTLLQKITEKMRS